MKIETTIKLTIGGSATEVSGTQAIELTESQARDLQKQLNKLFGNPAPHRSAPNEQSPICPQQWSIPAPFYGPSDLPFSPGKIYC